MIDWSTCRVEKRSYSRDPWRIVTADGQEIGRWEEYPGGGMPPILGRLWYARKRDAVAALDSYRSGPGQ